MSELIQTQKSPESLIQQICDEWKKNGYSVKSVYHKNPDVPYHLVI